MMRIEDLIVQKDFQHKINRKFIESSKTESTTKIMLIVKNTCSEDVSKISQLTIIKKKYFETNEYKSDVQFDLF